MKYLAAFLLGGLLGCGTPYEVARDIEPPELLSYAPLPPFAPLSSNRVLKLKVLICVKEDGTVEHARLVSSSGDASWDTLAERSIRQWRYAPPRRNGAPTDVWIRQTIVVKFDEPIPMSLWHLSAYSQAQADSLYALLIRGMDFEILVQQFAGGLNDRGGFLGTVDIRTYVPRVRESLRDLHEGEYTGPIRVGDKYVIYKRVKKVLS